MNVSRVLFVCLLFLLSVFSLSALNAELNSTEITLVLRTDGKADVYYTLDWSASGGRCTGSTSRARRLRLSSIPTPAMPTFRAGCGGPRNKGSRGTKYDVILSEGKGFSGNAFYYLAYGADLSGSGLLGKTVSPSLGN
jgi:hypothetical protein